MTNYRTEAFNPIAWGLKLMIASAVLGGVYNQCGHDPATHTGCHQPGLSHYETVE